MENAVSKCKQEYKKIEDIREVVNHLQEADMKKLFTAYHKLQKLPVDYVKFIANDAKLDMFRKKIDDKLPEVLTLFKHLKLQSKDKTESRRVSKEVVSDVMNALKIHIDDSPNSDIKPSPSHSQKKTTKSNQKKGGRGV